MRNIPKEHKNLISAAVEASNHAHESAIYSNTSVGKGKAVPLQAWTGPEGS